MIFTLVFHIGGQYVNFVLVECAAALDGTSTESYVLALNVSCSSKTTFAYRYTLILLWRTEQACVALPCVIMELVTSSR